MTDDDLIDAFHKAIEEHEAGKAGKGDYDETYKAVAAIEKATAARFGIGENWKRYRARYPRPVYSSDNVSKLGNVMRSNIHWIDAEIAGRLGIMARPRSGDWLDDEITAWREDGVDVVVSLLQKDEVQELELAREAELCLGAGLEFISFPIWDRAVPTSLEAAKALASLLSDEISKRRAEKRSAFRHL